MTGDERPWPSGEAQREPDLGRLARVMDALRAPTGCPWDHEQTLDTLKPYLLEECYEVLEVMGGADAAAHAEELGDLLFQIVFQAQLRSEQGSFQLADVVDAISDKLVRRHPHVFGAERIRDPGVVSQRWEELKRAEGKPTGPSGVSHALPALMRAAKVGDKARKVGFDWPDVTGPLAKVREELLEVEAELEAGDPARLHAEIGDLLFAVVNVARHLGVQPELALQDASTRFATRFDGVMARVADLPSEARTLERLDAAWEAEKTKELQEFKAP